MKRWILSLLTMATLVLVLIFPVAIPAAPPNAQPHAAAAAAEYHPEIQDAIAALRNARDHLNNARHDFGGHRVAAIQSIDDAIHQLKICMQYDN